MASASVRRNGIALVVLLARATLSVVTPSIRPLDSNEAVRHASPEFWYYISISAFLVLAGGVFAGYVMVSWVHLTSECS